MKSLIYSLLLFSILTIVGGEHPSFLHRDDPDAPLQHIPLELLPKNYDFVVVGSGAGGSVVASRLAQAFPRRDVLVVEGGWEGQRLVGGRDFVATKTRVNEQGVVVKDPYPYTKYDVWVYSQTIYGGDWFLNNTWGISNFPAAWHQHKVIGGNMACNGMAWQLPTKSSFDRWNVTGWSGNDVWPYYLALENYTGLPEAPNHNTSGPIKVSAPSTTPLLTTIWNSVLQAAGYTYQNDINSGFTQNNSYYPMAYTSRNGVRDSSSVALLAKTIKAQRNLFLATGCTVTVVLFNHHNNATGVECIDFFGKKWQFNARREVILSAGCLQTPKILMNSGIGPNSTLTAFNKTKRVVNELIGQKVMNQQYFNLNFVDTTLPNPNFYQLPVASVQYAAYGEGSFGPPAATNLVLWLNESNPEPDILILFSQASTAPTQSVYSQQFGILVQTTYQIYANATLNLTSADPLANTTWVTNVLVNEQDVNTMVLGVKKLRQIMQGWPNATETYPGPNVTSDADIAAAVRATGIIVGHFSGSVPLGETVEYPVDLRLKVRGVQKLRIADASVLHAQISRGMQATAAMIGQRAAKFIIEDHS